MEVFTFTPERFLLSILLVRKKFILKHLSPKTLFGKPAFRSNSMNHHLTTVNNWSLQRFWWYCMQRLSKIKQGKLILCLLRAFPFGSRYPLYLFWFYRKFSGLSWSPPLKNNIALLKFLKVLYPLATVLISWIFPFNLSAIAFEKLSTIALQTPFRWLLNILATLIISLMFDPKTYAPQLQKSLTASSILLERTVVTRQFASKSNSK